MIKLKINGKLSYVFALSIIRNSVFTFLEIEQSSRPTLPAFLSPNVANVLVENFGISGISSVEEDMNLVVEATT